MINKDVEYYVYFTLRKKIIHNIKQLTNNECKDVDDRIRAYLVMSDYKQLIIRNVKDINDIAPYIITRFGKYIESIVCCECRTFKYKNQIVIKLTV